MTALNEGSATIQSPRLIVLVTTSLVSSLIMLDSNIVAVSLPAIGRSLGASFTDIQWVISAYVLTYAALLLATGNYADLHGRRKAMLIGLIVFAVASVVCGVATTSLILDLARGVQGVGGALLLTASLAIISHEFAGEKRAGALAFWGASIGIALALGPIVGGAITNFFGWRWVFLVNVPACAVLTALTLKVVRESRDPDARQLDFASSRSVWDSAFWFGRLSMATMRAGPRPACLGELVRPRFALERLCSWNCIGRGRWLTSHCFNAARSWAPSWR